MIAYPPLVLRHAYLGVLRTSSQHDVTPNQPFHTTQYHMIDMLVATQDRVQNRGCGWRFLMPT